MKPHTTSLAALAAAALAGIASMAAGSALGGCAGKVPETRYYQLAAAPPAAPADERGTGGPVLVLEPLSADDAYQDERIVYRASPYRLDYYQYHRWSAPPGVMIAGALEDALERSGRFRAVVRDHDETAPVVLGGRVVAIEEVDESPTKWHGRIVVELTLKDARTGAVIWVEEIAETEPVAAQTPEGLAKALSAAMGRIAKRVIPTVAQEAERVVAQQQAAPVRAEARR